MQDFLKPIDHTLEVQIAYLKPGSIGQRIAIHTAEHGMPDLKNIKLAILGVGEKATSSETDIGASFSALRLSFYTLFPGNWNLPIVDLGDIIAGHSRADTLFAVQKVVETLLQAEVIPILLGGGQDLVYGQYRGYSYLNKMLHYVNIDNQFDIGDMEAPISSQSYVGKMVSTKPYRLFNYTVLGYQSYYNSADEIALLDKLLFDAYRLGNVTSDITKVEPYIRDADLVSLDVRSIQAAHLNNLYPHPNGLNSREVCALLRYAGLSNSCRSISIAQAYHLETNPQAALLLAQCIWYFIEGVNFRINDDNFEDDKYYKNYQVPIGEKVLHFKKSLKSGRWWIELPKSLHLNTKTKTTTLLACSYEEYVDACNQKIPERWRKALQKVDL